MKIKQQPHCLNNNTSGLSYSSNTTVFNSSNHNSTLTSNMLIMNDSPNSLIQSNSISSNTSSTVPTTIWTRSAAFKAAQQETTHFINDNIAIATSNLNNSYKRSHHIGTSQLNHHHLHHGHYQHVLGKIVKPIPVRPMSSSSSSSSTHSSLFNNHNSSSNANLATGVLLSNTKLVSSNSDIATNLNSTELDIDSSNLNCNINNSNQLTNGNGNFSLIAKYFASFPATRLKSTSLSNTSAMNQLSLDNTFHVCHHNHHFHHHHHNHHNSQSPVMTSNLNMSSINHETPTPTLLSNQKTKINTFMPFKKTVKQSQTTSPASNIQQSNESDKIQSTFILRSQSALSQANNSKSTNNLTNTDHLCTNFKRMIKLSDNHNHAIESDPTSPLTAASNTPTFDSSDLATPFELNHNSTFNFPNFDCDTNYMLPLNAPDGALASLSASASASNDQSSRFGQITMETRSTRKFLIKHHPYLQLNSNINNNSTNTNKLFNQQRPSINLIKMKKLVSKSNKINEIESNTRSGRNSRSNFIIDQEDSKLLKFTDTAPQIATSTTLNQSNYSLRVKNNTFKSTKTNSKTSKSKSITKTNNITANTLLTNKNTTINNQTEEWCCCLNGDYLENHECDNCFDEYDDGQEEDSSGYYSSYHSVDLVSSSGGGSIIGEKQDTKLNDLKPTSCQQQQQQQQVPVPQHHYHTRYLSNFLQQTNSSNCSPNTTVLSAINRTITATPSSLNNSKSSVSNTNTTPTTRLRYQQQLAAAAAAAASNNSSSKTSPTNNMKHMSSAYYSSQQVNNSRFHEHYQLECDLDLDQIEND